MEPPFSLDILLRRYGQRRGNIEAVYRRMFAEAMSLATPRSLQDTFPAAELPRLAAYLPGAETITLGLCSIGPDLEARVSALFKDAPVSAVVLDEIGTHWVKVLGHEMHQEIRTAARAMGKRASPSYRPGIGGWPVDLQDEIFARLPATTIGVRLLGKLMEPQKSISMIVAIGAKLGRSLYAPSRNSQSSG